MLEINFTKMHGIKNSFVIVRDLANFLTQEIDVFKLAKEICSYQSGIGADGLVLLQFSETLALTSSEVCDFKMLIYNADGSEAKMCGNAIRCLAKYVYDEDILKKEKISFFTLSGLIQTQLLEKSHYAARVRVDMGVPKVSKLLVIDILGKKDSFYLANVGNSHLVKIVDNFNFDYRKEAHLINKNKEIFPEGVNIEFVKIISEGEIEVRVVENGVGETLACGTGACAAVVVLLENNFLKSRKVKVVLRGGELEIFWNGENIFMTGDTQLVGKGVYYYDY